MFIPAWTATGAQIDPVSNRIQTRAAPATVVTMTVIITWATPARLRSVDRPGLVQTGADVPQAEQDRPTPQCNRFRVEGDQGRMEDAAEHRLFDEGGHDRDPDQNLGSGLPGAHGRHPGVGELIP